MNLHIWLNQFAQEVWHAATGPYFLSQILIMATFVFAAVWTYVTTAEDRSWRGLWRHTFPPGTFKHPSARADFMFWLSRRITMPFLVVPLGISTIGAGYGIHRLLEAVFGPPAHSPEPASPLILALFTLSMLLAYDLSYYIYHYLQHKIPVLWELHKVHHSAKVMVGVTKDRIHPIDEIMVRWWDGLIPGATFAVWLYFVLKPVEVTIFGLDVLVIRNIFFMMDFVRHTHIKFSYGRILNHVFLCPHWHQLHHSVAREHWDKNFGLALSVWDWLFGTLVVPKPNETFEFGLTDNEDREFQSLTRLYVVPLKKIAKRLRPQPLADHTVEQL